MRVPAGPPITLPPLSPSLKQQLESVPPSIDPIGIEYRPCSVTLVDGMRDDFVYVQEAENWSRVWLWDRRIPEGALTVDSVLSISESPRRLPVELANRLYAEGETGMGYYAFALVLPSGREVPCLTGNAVDFMDLPADLDPRDVVDVRIGTRYLDESESGCGGAGKWCFYAADPSKQFITHPHLD